MYSAREEVENWLILMGVENYIINEDLTVDVNGDVDISCKKLKKMPINFSVINGNFDCSYNELTDLKDCPKEIRGYFNCGSNYLTSLEGFPKEIKGSFNCIANKLTNLKYCPEIINGSFYCGENKLTSLEGCLEVINGNFDCSDNKLTSFEYFPKMVKGEVLKISLNMIKEEELVNFNCKMENIKKIYSSFNKERNVEDFLKKVNYYKSKKENELLKELSINSNNVKLNKKL